MADVILKDVNKVYPNGFHAVYDFNIHIKHGDFIVLAGPSGCGKSTTLRMIAGLEEISSGDLIVNGKRCNDLAPRDRDIAMVFQNYALYGHMTVYHNMAFSLLIRKYDSDEIHRRVMAAAEILGLVPYLNRKPKQLSGGQRQRVAVGRSIVRNPAVFLFDEPLSNLDAKLRGSMRKELAILHKKLNATFIYVTHDQIEALTLATRIVVMKDGYVQQIDTPKNMFDNPRNLFVAGFIGTPPMNFYQGKIEADGYFHFENGPKVKILPEKFAELKDLGYVGKAVVMASRPDYTYMDDAHLAEFKDSVVEFKIDTSEMLGSYYLVYGDVANQTVISKVLASAKIDLNRPSAKLAFDMKKVHFFDKETEMRITKEEI